MSYHYTTRGRNRPGYGGIMSWLAPASDIVAPTVDVLTQTGVEAGGAWLRDEATNVATPIIQKEASKYVPQIEATAGKQAADAAAKETREYWGKFTMVAIGLVVMWLLFFRKGK